MNTRLSQGMEFSALVQQFFAGKLLAQQAASPRTVASYRDTFRLILGYAEQSIGKKPVQLTVEDFNADLILGFLNHLESARHNAVRSRNAGLAAIRSFAHFVSIQYPAALLQTQRILAIPMKRFEKPLLSFLSKEETRILLDAPQNETWCARRDRIILRMLYNTGARVSELINVCVKDVELGAGPSVRLHGKGRKQRTVPIWPETARGLRDWIKYAKLEPQQALIPNRWGKRMTRANVAERLSVAVRQATISCPSFVAKKISPHTMRHTTAMHLLQSGVDITVIALWLGHESPVTTHGYVEADMTMKERALATIAPPDTGETRYHPSDQLLSFLKSL